jgi:hypothetical protein
LRLFALTLTLTLTLTRCTTFRPEPITITKTDTVTVVKEIAPPSPTGDSTEICLSTGMTARVLVSAKGDTLIGDTRVRLRDVQPVLAFAGIYAADQEWYSRGDTLRFENKVYRRAGGTMKRACDELKLVGHYRGVPVFASVTEPQGLPTIVVPITPGLFQNYRNSTRNRK